MTPITPKPTTMLRKPLALARWPFTGGAGLRGGWRVLLFFALFIAGSAVLEPRLPNGDFTPWRMLVRESAVLSLVLAATLLLGAFEGRSLGDYGLPLRRSARRQMGFGIVLGVLALASLLLTLRLCGVFSLGPVVLGAGAILSNALAWAAAFLLVALFEELLLRGYAQATLARSIGFWPSALLLSGLFASMHAHNPGETPLGLAAVFVFGLFFSLTLWRTGNLWLAVGFHASWDWAESFLYGVPDSGTMMRGRLFDASFRGPDWLTGGTAGPEGSLLILVALVAAGAVVNAVRPGVPRSVPRAA